MFGSANTFRTYIANMHKKYFSQLVAFKPDTLRKFGILDSMVSTSCKFSNIPYYRQLIWMSCLIDEYNVIHKLHFLLL